jgi:hypothetical protein
LNRGQVDGDDIDAAIDELFDALGRDSRSVSTWIASMPAWRASVTMSGNSSWRSGHRRLRR